MDGHSSAVAIHPSSGLFDKQDGLDWVIYKEAVFTTKAYMRTVSPIRSVTSRHATPRHATSPYLTPRHLM
jgi:hypothetical protein